jgi:NCS2 family nucleobase:cation symporter-2
MKESENIPKTQADRTDALYTLEGNPGLGKILPYSIQQLLAMFVSNLVPVSIIGAAAVPALTQAEILSLMQSAMIAAGIATFLQATPIWTCRFSWA